MASSEMEIKIDEEMEPGQFFYEEYMENLLKANAKIHAAFSWVLETLKQPEISSRNISGNMRAEILITEAVKRLGKLPSKGDYTEDIKKQFPLEQSMAEHVYAQCVQEMRQDPDGDKRKMFTKLLTQAERERVEDSHSYRMYSWKDLPYGKVGYQNAEVAITKQKAPNADEIHTVFKTLNKEVMDRSTEIPAFSVKTTEDTRLANTHYYKEYQRWAFTAAVESTHEKLREKAKLKPGL